jgi:hypothetical protein
MDRKLAFIFLLFCSFAQGQMLQSISNNVSHVGGGGGHTFSAPAGANNRCYDGVSSPTVSIGCNLGTAPPSGSFTTVTIFLQPSTISPVVSDGTNTFSCTTISSTNDATSGSTAVCYLYNSSTGGTNITFAFTGTCNFCSLTVDNWGVTGAGAVTLSDSQSGSGTTGTTINTPTITGNSGDLQVCQGASENGVSAVAGGWTAEPATGSFGEKTEYVLSGAGAKAANFTQTSGHWDSKCAAFH